MLKVVVYINEEEEVGHFYIPDNADEKWFRKNAPMLLYGVQILAEEHIIIGDKKEVKI